MSLDSQTRVACPKCKQVGPFTQHHSVNATRDPATKARLLSGELTRFTCAACGATANVAHPLLYNDMTASWMVYLVPGDDAAREKFREENQALPGLDPAAVRTRMVWDFNGLRDKVMAIDAGLDDRLLEVTKLVLKLQNKELQAARLLFESLQGDQLHLAAVTDTGVQRFSVGRDGTYAFMADKLEKAGVLAMPLELWEVVGERWAAWALAKANGRDL